MHKLKEKLWDELEELDDKAGKEKLSVGDLEMAHKLTDTIKNIDKICMLEDDGDGYSQAGNWEAMGRMNGTYGGGNSYANRGKHLVREHYSRAGRRRDMRGRYSGDNGFREMLEDAAEAAPDDRTREKLERMAREA